MTCAQSVDLDAIVYIMIHPLELDEEFVLLFVVVVVAVVVVEPNQLVAAGAG